MNKEIFYKALITNNGKLDEISLGETLGLSEDATMKIISALLAEYKIEYTQHGACNYSII
ncbi:MAG TPA: hypothetical protein VHO72_17110 [Bacteroidales bacterium]|nr:hypothetical protein [Bacteroidales bacterium]